MATLQELHQQRAALEAQIAEETRKGRAEALTQIRSIMNAFGLTAEDLGRGRFGQKRPGPVSGVRQPKFQNPQTGQTWTGQGKRPNWLVEALNKGGNITDFLINKGNGAPAAPAPTAEAPKTVTARKGPVRKSPASKKGRR
jgi:DNA-binding protein H-NS